MSIINKEVVEEAKKNNPPGTYGGYGIAAAEGSMEILDKGEPIKSCHHIITEGCRRANGDCDLTGFQAGMVARLIVKVHSRGEEFNDKWNDEHGVSKEKAKGRTVNPAIVTIDTKDTKKMPDQPTDPK